MKTYYTVDEIAKICTVTPDTVRNWIEKGLSIEKLGLKPPKVLVVSKLHDFYLPLTDELRANSIECYIANSIFYAGTLADLFQPECVVVYTEIGRNEALSYCKRLKEHPQLKYSIQIVIDPSSDSAEDWSFVDEYLVVNFDAIPLTSKILDQLKKNGFYQVSDLEHAKDAQ